MVSESIGAAILMIAGIVVSSMIGVVFITQSTLFTNMMKVLSNTAAERVSTSVDIAYVAINSSGGLRYIVIFAKNTGSRSMASSEIMKIDIYVHDENHADLYIYSSSQQPDSWGYSETLADGVWSPGETLVFKVYNVTSYTIPFHIKLVLPNGVSCEYTYGG